MKKTYKVQITGKAQSDFHHIYDYISQDNPQNAISFVDALESRINGLQQYPERCQLIPENKYLGTRMRHLIHKDYRVIFRIEDTVIYILRIMHGAALLEM